MRKVGQGESKGFNRDSFWQIDCAGEIGKSGKRPESPLAVPVRLWEHDRDNKAETGDWELQQLWLRENASLKRLGWETLWDAYGSLLCSQREWGTYLALPVRLRESSGCSSIKSPMRGNNQLWM